MSVHMSDDETKKILDSLEPLPGKRQETWTERWLNTEPRTEENHEKQNTD
jgi:hypothetical protein